MHYGVESGANRSRTRRSGGCSTCSSTTRCTARCRSPARSRRCTALSEHADVVVLTNLLDHRQATRTAQLAGHGLDVRVFTNQGPKGPGAAGDTRRVPTEPRRCSSTTWRNTTIRWRAPRRTSTACTCAASRGWQGHIACAFEAGHADARIDTWEHALPWLMDRHRAAQHTLADHSHDVADHQPRRRCRGRGRPDDRRRDRCKARRAGPLACRSPQRRSPPMCRWSSPAGSRTFPASFRSRMAHW